MENRGERAHAGDVMSGAARDSAARDAQPAETGGSGARVAQRTEGEAGLKGHMPALDGVRGLAILMVLITHFVADVKPVNLLEHVATRVAGYGMFGVDLFFVLSGFLITGILLDSKRPGGYLAYFRNFYMRRSLRIFPLYYGVLFCLFVVAPLVPFFRGPELDTLTREQGWAWSYLVNVFIWRHGGYGMPYIDHFWSLAVEEHFYFVWPLIVWACSRRSLVKVSLAIAIASLLPRVLLADHLSVIGMYVLTPFRLSALCLGGLLAAVARGPGGVDRVSRAAAPMAIASAAVLVGSYAFNHFVPAFFAPLHELRNTTFTVMFGALIVYSLVASPASAYGRFFHAKSMRFLGKYSYGLYVFHHFFSYYFLTHGTADALAARLGSHTLAVTVLALVGSAASIAVSMASFRFFEKPFLSLKRYFPSSEGSGEQRPRQRQEREEAAASAAPAGGSGPVVAGAAQGEAAALAAVSDSPSSAQ